MSALAFFLRTIINVLLISVALVDTPLWHCAAQISTKGAKQCYTAKLYETNQFLPMQRSEVLTAVSCGIEHCQPVSFLVSLLVYRGDPF
jgi:hypothetical protein